MSDDFEDWGLEATLSEVRLSLQDWINHGNPEGFECRALALFRWQAERNPLMREFVHAMGIRPDEVKRVEDIPFLPIQFFKSAEIKSGSWATSHVFRSSGTTDAVQKSNHLIDADGLEWYRHIAQTAWMQMWRQEVHEYHWLGLLPGYTGREDASLLTMVKGFMTASGQFPDNAMLMNDPKALRRAIERWSRASDRQPLVIVGVTWAVLDWMHHLDNGPQWLNGIPWEEVLLVDTGGVKGRDVEPTRLEVLSAIRRSLPQVKIASEYGMTEMFSQGYALDGEHHQFPSWVRPLVRDVRDPLSEPRIQRTGRLDIIDLANVHSCSFVATQDLAEWTDEGLKILGRTDHSEVRGCSLLATP